MISFPKELSQSRWYR